MSMRRHPDALVCCVPAECLHFSIFFSPPLLFRLCSVSLLFVPPVPFLSLAHPLSPFQWVSLSLSPSPLSVSLFLHVVLPLMWYLVPETCFAASREISLGRSVGALSASAAVGKTTSEGTSGSRGLAALIPDQPFIYNVALVDVRCRSGSSDEEL